MRASWGSKGWVEAHFGLLGVGGHFLWVGRSKKGLGESTFWVYGAGWTFFICWWGWIEVSGELNSGGWGMDGYFLWVKRSEWR